MLWLGFHAVPISQNVMKYEEARKFVENGKKVISEEKSLDMVWLL
jgi:hypothetical protein